MRFLSFDFGLKRIGVAVGNSEFKHTQPVVTLTNQKTVMQEITDLIKTWQIDGGLIVGMPSTNDKMLINKIRKFIHELSQTRLPIHVVNEDFTSYNASAKMTAQYISKKHQKQLIDSWAAADILEIFFANV
jgi:putative Holliday junction resolvase